MKIAYFVSSLLVATQRSILLCSIFKYVKRIEDYLSSIFLNNFVHI